MILKDKETENLIKVSDIESLINPSKNSIGGKVQSGQEEQDTTDFAKESLQFPSGEDLPRCWLDADYQKA
jgi:hypothetical protein